MFQNYCNLLDSNTSSNAILTDSIKGIRKLQHLQWFNILNIIQNNGRGRLPSNENWAKRTLWPKVSLLTVQPFYTRFLKILPLVSKHCSHRVFSFSMCRFHDPFIWDSYHLKITTDLNTMVFLIYQLYMFFYGDA